MSERSETTSHAPDGCVYRVPGPDGQSDRWIARSVHGPVAHGMTPESAAANLMAGMTALARASGQTLAQWHSTHGSNEIRFLRSGELVQA